MILENCPITILLVYITVQYSTVHYSTAPSNNIPGMIITVTEQYHNIPAGLNPNSNVY